MNVRRAPAHAGSDTAPIAADYREAPVWLDGGASPPGESDGLPGEAVVVVIGAGYTGLAAALQLGRRGIPALVLDAGAIGQGASSRNAGMVHGGLRYPGADVQRRHGAAGLALHQASLDAYGFVARLAREVAPDSEHSECGWLYMAHRPSRMDQLRRAEVARREQNGEVTRLLTAEELVQETRCSGFHGGLLTSNGASLHPRRYLAGLARAAAASGARVHEHIAVTGVVARRGSATGFTVNTTRGSIAARDVLAATNGYTDGALPQLRRRIIPIGSYIIATEPLDGALVDEINPHRRVMTDTRDFLHYWRLTADHRLVFGGRTSLAPVSLQRARDRLYAAMVRMYPQLAGVRVSHAWSGKVGFTFDRLPHLGRRDGITYAMGYCGSGVAMASWLGTLAATWIADGEGSAPPFATLRFPTAPGYRGDPWFLPVAGLYYQLRDRLY